MNSNNKKKIEKNSTNNTVKQYQNEIAELKQQISSLTMLLKEICTTMIPDKEKSKSIIEKINTISPLNGNNVLTQSEKNSNTNNNEEVNVFNNHQMKDPYK